MAAISILGGFLLIVLALNVIDFGRVD